MYRLFLNRHLILRHSPNSQPGHRTWPILQPKWSNPQRLTPSLPGSVRRRPTSMPTGGGPSSSPSGARRGLGRSRLSGPRHRTAPRVRDPLGPGPRGTAADRGATGRPRGPDSLCQGPAHHRRRSPGLRRGGGWGGAGGARGPAIPRARQLAHGRGADPCGLGKLRHRPPPGDHRRRRLPPHRGCAAHRPPRPPTAPRRRGRRPHAAPGVFPYRGGLDTSAPRTYPVPPPSPSGRTS